MTESKTELETSVRTYERTQTVESIRDVFNKIDLTDINANNYEFPLPDDGTPGIVREGEELERTGLSYETRTVGFDKFGFEVTDDCDTDDIAANLDVFNASIAHHAYSEIDAEVGTSFRHVDSISDVIPVAISEAGTTVPYHKQSAVVVSSVLAASIADADPERDWDELRADLEAEHGVLIVADQYNTMAGSDVLVIDADRFGYECVRTEFMTDTYTEYKEHCPAAGREIPEDEREIVNEVVQAYTRLGFAVIDPEAGHRVRFPTF